MQQAIIPAQIRAARALLNWPQEKLAEAAGVALTSVRDLEAEKRASDSGTSANVREAEEGHILDAIRKAFDQKDRRDELGRLHVGGIHFSRLTG